MINRYIVPGKEYAANVRQFCAEIKSVLEQADLGNNVGFPIKRLFELFPLNALDNSLASRLIARGELIATATETKSGNFFNTGDWIEIKFGDDNIGILSLTFDQTVTGNYSVETNGQEFSFNFDPPIPLILEKPPQDLTIPRSQLVASILFRKDNVDYTLYSEIDIKDETVISVDLNMERPLDVLNEENHVRELNFNPAQVIVCVALTCVWCANQGNRNPDKPDHRIPGSNDRNFDYSFYCDCVKSIQGDGGSKTIIAYFTRRPTWDKPKDMIGKSLQIKYYFKDCSPPADGSDINFGTYIIKIATIHENINQPNVFIISGLMINP